MRRGRDLLDTLLAVAVAATAATVGTLPATGPSAARGNAAVVSSVGDRRASRKGVQGELRGVEWCWWPIDWGQRCRARHATGTVARHLGWQLWHQRRYPRRQRDGYPGNRTQRAVTATAAQHTANDASIGKGHDWRYPLPQNRHPPPQPVMPGTRHLRIVISRFFQLLN